MDNANPQSEQIDPTGSDMEQTPLQDPPAEVSEEVVRSHPLFKKLEDDYSAAEREKNRYKGRLDKVQKDPVKQEYVTKEELWERDHAKDLELYGDDKYKADIESGIPKEYALETAKLRLQSSPNNARLGRQQEMASGSAMGVRSLSEENYEGFNQEDANRFGYTKETWLKQQKIKKARSRI